MTTLSDLQVNDREELIYLLTEAAEFEHTVMCTYLYALWSLKRDVDDGVTAAELAAIEGWRQSILGVALEEMLHLSLVNNILADNTGDGLWTTASTGRLVHNTLAQNGGSGATIARNLLVDRARKQRREARPQRGVEQRIGIRGGRRPQGAKQGAGVGLAHGCLLSSSRRRATTVAGRASPRRSSYRSRRMQLCRTVTSTAPHRQCPVTAIILPPRIRTS